MVLLNAERREEKMRTKGVFFVLFLRRLQKRKVGQQAVEKQNSNSIRPGKRNKLPFKLVMGNHTLLFILTLY